MQDSLASLASGRGKIDNGDNKQGVIFALPNIGDSKRLGSKANEVNEEGKILPEASDVGGD